MEELKAIESKYRPCVRIGNWYEERCLEEEEIKKFLEKKEKGELLVQKIERLYENLLKEVVLDPPNAHIRFGAIVQIVATDIKHSENQGDMLPVLSISIPEERVEMSQKISESCELTVAPSVKPCVRNTFVIVSSDAEDRSSEILKYGQDFMLQCVETEDDKPLMLFCSPKNCNLTNVTETDKSNHLPLGLCGKFIPNKCSLPLIPSGHCRWKCQHINPTWRFETEGNPVPSNSRLVITHCPTNQNLAAENIKFDTLFGKECVISVHTFQDQLKREQWQNVWSITISKEEEK